MYVFIFILTAISMSVINQSISILGLPLQGIRTNKGRLIHREEQKVFSTHV